MSSQHIIIWLVHTTCVMNFSQKVEGGEGIYLKHADCDVDRRIEHGYRTPESTFNRVETNTLMNILSMDRQVVTSRKSVTQLAVSTF